METISLRLNTTAAEKDTGFNWDKKKQMIFPYLSTRQG